MNWSRSLIHGSNESNISKTSNFEGGCTIIIGILNNIAEGTRSAYCEAKYSLQKTMIYIKISLTRGSSSLGDSDLPLLRFIFLFLLHLNPPLSTTGICY